MVIITSQEQNNFIAEILPEEDGNYYIGLEDMDNNAAYRWIDGTMPGYNNLLDTLAQEEGSPYCGVIRSLNHDQIHGKWNRVTCTSQRRHICQIPVDVGCRWHELGESQYLIMDEPIATLNDARTTCQSYGGDLALVTTAEINSFLKNLLPPCPSCPNDYFCYWFGLQRSGMGNFSWIDGTELSYNNWDTATELNEPNTWGCLGLRPGPSWYDQDPSHSFPCICERTRVLDEDSEALFGGMNYFISSSWMDRSYSDARTYCQYHGADLALITSEDINTFLSERNRRSPWKCSFFGLTDQAAEGNFTWIDGTPLQYSPWAIGEPNGLDNEDCVCLSSDSNTTWHDKTCSSKRPFICERYEAVPESEWTRLGRTEYYISQFSMTSYSFARRFCQGHGGDLAQPKTEEINNLLIGLAEGNSFWIGLDSLQQEGVFQWIDGTAAGNETFTVQNIVADWENESCVHQFVTRGWNRRPCTSYIRFACERDIVPVLSSAPEEYETGANHFVIRWRQWNSTTDVGDGPVMAYKVYVYSGNGSLVHSATVDPASGCATEACDVLQYNVTGLEPLMIYSVRISVIQEGFEGDQGPALIITTDEIVTPTPADGRTNVLLTTEFKFLVTDEYMMAQCPSMSLASWILLGISLMGNVVLVVLMCFQKRRAPSALQSEPSKTKDDPSPRYENPAFDSSKDPDAHTYQDLTTVRKEDNYEELQEGQRDYVNVSGP